MVVTNNNDAQRIPSRKALHCGKEGFAFYTTDFRDAILMRYSFKLPNLPIKCVCGFYFDIYYAMVCQRGGFVSCRHNDMRDNLCNILDDVCHDVIKEPPLQPLTRETFDLQSTNTSKTGRLDITARGFWSPSIPQRAFFNVRVFYQTPPAISRCL